MNYKDEKKRKCQSSGEEDEDEEKCSNQEDEEDNIQGKGRQRSGEECRGNRDRKQIRMLEGKERGRKREEERSEKETSPDNFPVHPVAAPYFKWKVFVRGSEGTLEGRGVGVGGEEWSDKHTFTSTLDGEATRSFYESITGPSDANVDRERGRQFDTHSDTQIDREEEKDSNIHRLGGMDRDSESSREIDRHELCRDKDRNKGREERYRCREKEINANIDNGQREGYRNATTSRKRRESTNTHADSHKQTLKSKVSTHSTHAVDTHPHTRPTTSTLTPTHTFTPQDTHTALRFAQDNDVTGLSAMLEQGMSVNTKDVYGWSLLMVAACAGAADVVRMLLQHKARTGFRDAKGNTALYLATIRGHRSVIEMLIKANKRRIPELEDKRERNGESASSSVETTEEEYFCEACGITVKERERTKHKASIVHQFKTDSGPVRTHYGIPPTNRGYQLLVGQGWDTEGGLGSEKQGQKFPVKTVLKRDREGLGAGGEGKGKARVTHFGPGDAAAVKRARDRGERVERAGTVSRKEMRRRKEREQMEEVRLRRMLNEPDY